VYSKRAWCLQIYDLVGKDILDMWFILAETTEELDNERSSGINERQAVIQAARCHASLVDMAIYSDYWNIMISDYFVFNQWITPANMIQPNAHSITSQVSVERNCPYLHPRILTCTQTTRCSYHDCPPFVLSLRL